MASILERFELAPEESSVLQEAEHFESLSQSPAWQKLKLHMTELVTEAFEAMAGNLSNEPMAYMRLQIRWQQRRAMMLAINQYVDSMTEARRELIRRATEEIDEYGTDS